MEQVMFGHQKTMHAVLSFVIGILAGLGFLLFSYSFKSVPGWYPVFFALAGSSLAYGAIFWNIGWMKRPLKWASFLFSLVLSVIVTFALKGPQQHLAHQPFLINCLIYLATVLFLLFAMLLAIKILYALTESRAEGDVPRRHILYFSILPLLISLLYFWAFYPGILMADSVNQWQQAHSTFYNDWHPAVMTWLIKFTAHIWDTPASYVIFQFILTALITGYVFYVFEKLRVKKPVLWLGYAFFCFLPLIPLYSVVIWKDTLFSYFLLAFTVMLIQIIDSNGKWLRSFPHLLFLYFSVCGVIFYRHNGWPVLLATIVIFLFFLRKRYLYMYGVFALAVITFLVVTGPVYKHYKVFPADETESYSIPYQQIGRIVKENGHITPAQRAVINQVMPIPDWKKYYHPTDVDMIKFRPHFDRAYIKSHKKAFFSTWFALCRQNPKLALEAFYDQEKLSWKLYIPDEDLRRPIFRNKDFEKYRPVYFMTQKNVQKYHVHYKWFYYKDYGSDLANKTLSSWITQINQRFSHGILRVLLMPAFYLYLILLFLFTTILKGNWRLVIAAVPMFLNLGSMFAAIPAQDIRYFFPNFLLAVPFFFLATLTSRKRDSHG
ncbi:DUF6020 family protein [Heyndrickxia coagulans]|uniref:DUF6020 family protein n=1 Tax=Heyndrickxia coagulans TaxID=1398 RepID=UPI003D2FC550